MKKSISYNRKAKHDYFIEDHFEAGLILTGTEIKAIRKGSAQIKDSYVDIEAGEAFVNDMYIGHYEQGNRFNHEERRPRKLLLHKKEIALLARKVQLKGYTIVPIELYLDKGLAKLEIALARGKNLYDKRQTEKSKDAQREIEKNTKNYY